MHERVTWALVWVFGEILSGKKGFWKKTTSKRKSGGNLKTAISNGKAQLSVIGGREFAGLWPVQLTDERGLHQETGGLR